VSRSEYTEEAVAAYAWAWNAAGGNVEQYEQMAAVETARLHEKYPSVFRADMRPPTRQEIIVRLFKP
jgi:hypothetical protein